MPGEKPPLIPVSEIRASNPRIDPDSLGDGFQSDIDILTKLADAYPKENINPKGRSTQLSDIIEKKCK
jgi:hypothetical protein